MVFTCNTCRCSYSKQRDVDRLAFDNLDYVEVYNIANTNIKYTLCGRCINIYSSKYINYLWTAQIPLIYSHTEFKPHNLTDENIVIYVKGSHSGLDSILVEEEFLFFGLDEFKLWVDGYNCSNMKHYCHKKNCLNTNYKAYISDLNTTNFDLVVKTLLPHKRLSYFIKETPNLSDLLNVTLQKKPLGVITLLEDHLETKYYKPKNPSQFLFEYKQKQSTQLENKKKELQNKMQILMNENGKFAVEEHALNDAFNQLEKLKN